MTRASHANLNLRQEGLHWGLRALVVALFAVGVASRTAPLLDRQGRLLRQWPTEDGYLTLTIARNIAIGHGMSTAAGTMPTNGTQPLCTFLWALGYWLARGDKVAGVAVVQVWSVLIAGLGALALYRLGRTVLVHHPRARPIAALASAVWFASPLVVPHSMNCLETGTYALVVIWSLHALVAASRDAEVNWTALRCVALGALLGVAFWIRNDACLLILAACLARCLSGLRRHAARRVFEVVAMGAASVAVACPWLIYNRLAFGSVMPISGVAESMDARFAQNLPGVPVKLTEYVLMVLPIPRRFESHGVLIAGCVVCAVIAAAILVGLYRRGTPALRTAVGVVAIYALGLCGFYGLYFGAGHFLARYLMPLAAFSALLWAGVVMAGLDVFRGKVAAPLRAIGGVALVLLVTAPNVLLYRDGYRHRHFQVVEWVRANVPAETWVGAIQSGTLGYFHDRTINLDGKVNPDATRARRERRMPQYVAEQGIEYLADWSGIATWADIPAYRVNYELVVNDPARNLAVLRRRAPD